MDTSGQQSANRHRREPTFASFRLREASLAADPMSVGPAVYGVRDAIVVIETIADCDLDDDAREALARAAIALLVAVGEDLERILIEQLQA